MPKITFDNRIIECEAGANLRRVLLDEKMPLYNGAAKLIHCRGLGTCGTCAVQIEGHVSAMTGVEKWRLGFPPHCREDDLRLACQCQVRGDLKIVKLAGLWGNRNTATTD